MGFYIKNSDKKSGDGLALTEWNDLSNAVAGNSGLTLALNSTDKVGVGVNNPTEKIEVSGTVKATKFIGDGSELTGLSMGLDENGRLGIGVTNAEGTLDVARGTATWGTAMFRGTQRASHFSAQNKEHTMIRGGKIDSYVLLNDNGGNVGIGTDSPSDTLDVKGALRISTDTNQLRMWVDDEAIMFQLGTSYYGPNRAVRWDGDTNWDAYSDRRLKTNIENEEGILQRLMKLDVKNYDWKDSAPRETKMLGFMAQDVQPLFPALVGGVKDPETGDTTLTLKYANFGVLAVGAIKEMKQEYDKKFAALEEQIAALQSKLDAL